MKISQVWGLCMATIALMVAPGLAKEENEFEFGIGEKKIEIGVKTETETRKGELDFELEAKNEYFRAKMEFESETENGEVEKSIKNEIRLLIREIIEFVPSGPDAGYNGETPERTYPTDLTGNWVWNNLVHEVDGTSHTFTASTSDGVFTVVAKYAESATGEVNSEQIKLDFKVQNFPYTNGGNTKLAFKCQARSKNKMKTKQDDDKVETEVESSVNQGALTWIEDADVDGSNVNIITTIGQEESDETEGRGPNIFFTVNTVAAATSIVWDPTIGVNNNSSSGLPIALIVGASVGGVAVLGAAIFILKRRASRSTDENNNQVAP